MAMLLPITVMETRLIATWILSLRKALVRRASFGGFESTETRSA